MSPDLRILQWLSQAKPNFSWYFSRFCFCFLIFFTSQLRFEYYWVILTKQGAQSWAECLSNPEVESVLGSDSSISSHVIRFLTNHSSLSYWLPALLSWLVASKNQKIKSKSIYIKWIFKLCLQWCAAWKWPTIFRLSQSYRVLKTAEDEWSENSTLNIECIEEGLENDGRMNFEVLWFK